MELRTISCRAFATQGHSLFLFFSNGEEIVRWVRGETSEAEREWRDAPPLNRLLARDRWRSEETESLIFHVAVSEEIPAGGRDEMSFRV